jgi:dienelactone hydrolase
VRRSVLRFLTVVSPNFSDQLLELHTLGRICRQMSKTKRIPRAAASLILLGAAAWLAACSAPTQQNAWESRAPNRAKALDAAVPPPAAERFQAQLLEWQDADRKRSVLAKLYLPAGETSLQKMPLVVFSHGIGGSREGYSYLGKHWAANGVAVLHLQHAGSDRSVWFGNPVQMVTRLQSAAQETEAVDRAKDVRLALDRVLADSAFAQKIDAQRIAVAGHSYGANTAMLLAGAQVQRESGALSLRDPRIKAALLLSAPPFYGEGDPKAIVGGIEIPTLHVTATADDITIPGYRSGYKDRQEIFEAMSLNAPVPKTFAVFTGGSHSVFTDRLGTGGSELNPQIKLATRELGLAFWSQVFAGDAQAVQRWQGQHAPMLAKFERRG